jgi:NADP-dependent 3-hydroxy acid dehydrogenase YdfG
MKVAITGHTRGIGKALVKSFSDSAFETIGFSRSNGYDITDENVISKILEEISDCDIFINNAYAPRNQTMLLEKVTEQWTGTDKVIVNISSMWCYYDSEHEFVQDYKQDKLDQNEFINKKIKSAVFQPKIINVVPGVTDTDMTKDLQIYPSINPEDLADTVCYIVDRLDKVFVREIVIDTIEYPYYDSEWFTHS